MKKLKMILIGIVIFASFSCRNTLEKEVTNHVYFDVSDAERSNRDSLFAITDGEYLEYGSNVAYVNKEGDTLIPFGKYAYFGTSSFVHFATVMEHPNDTTYGRQVGINAEQQILFDIVLYDNGPEFFRDDLLRVLRNGKMGFADRYGKIVIPCKYDYVKWFYDGVVEVSFDAEEYWDRDGHLMVDSDEWFLIDREGNRVKD
jgi:hypothetical protein